MNDLFNWLKTRQIELQQLMDIEVHQKQVLIPQVNKINEALFLYKYEDILLKNLEQLVLLQVYIESDSKIENYDFFTYTFSILKNIRESTSFPESNYLLNGYREYFIYLNSVYQELEKNLQHIEEIMRQKYEAFLFNIQNAPYKPKIEYSKANIAEKFSVKCSGHLERLSLLSAYEQDWKICKSCHAFICPTCASSLETCPNLARNKHNLELIGLPLENIINFLEYDNQRSRIDESFIIMDKSDKISDFP